MKYQGDLVLVEIPEEARTGHQVYDLGGKAVVAIDVGLWEEICAAAPGLVGLQPDKAQLSSSLPRKPRSTREGPAKNLGLGDSVWSEKMSDHPTRRSLLKNLGLGDSVWLEKMSGNPVKDVVTAKSSRTISTGSGRKFNLSNGLPWGNSSDGYGIWVKFDMDTGETRLANDDDADKDIARRMIRAHAKKETKE